MIPDGKPPRERRLPAGGRRPAAFRRAIPRRRSAHALDLDAFETGFDLVAPRGDELVDVFYARLFAAAPAVRPLFAGTNLDAAHERDAASRALP